MVEPGGGPARRENHFFWPSRRRREGGIFHASAWCDTRRCDDSRHGKPALPGEEALKRENPARGRPMCSGLLRRGPGVSAVHKVGLTSELRYLIFTCSNNLLSGHSIISWYLTSTLDAGEPW